MVRGGLKDRARPAARAGVPQSGVTQEEQPRLRPG
jgi:hypothetical protein